MENYIQEILQGKIFIYPTDTIYGIGCNAYNKDSVNKIKEIKTRDKDKALSVIAPSFKWIEEHCIVDVDLGRYLPGPYTILLKKKDKNFLDYVSNNEFLGIRIPDCGFSKKVKRAKVPFITTSVNLSGEPFAINIEDISNGIIKKVDIIIDEGELNGKPSTIIKEGKEIFR